MKTLKIFFATLALLAASGAQAVTVGSLSRTTGSSFINDTLNSRQWLGWDVTAGMSYAQIQTATQAGGQFAGYSVARNADAQMFVNALFGTNSCTASSANSTCGWKNMAGVETLVGESFLDYQALYGWTYDPEVALFLSDNGTGQAVGWLEVMTYPNGNEVDYVIKYNEWGDFTTANDANRNFHAGWLLYRAANLNEVPLPATLPLLALGLLALGLSRRR